ncbi:serine carboxypeptidase [Thozetella sp. PMI_491]|nr:serine carboxypeptidase [Thozetella sp. PMI_491]
MLPLASAQFVSPPKELIDAVGYAGVPVRYKEVPVGICELDPAVKSFSGYADVGDDEHIFWWFFEKRGSSTDAPLTVWLNGGPGASSMIGLFQELGPCGIDFFGAPYSNPYSWSNVSNILFIDQPNHVGFSYAKTVPGYKRRGDVVVLPQESCPEYATECGTYSYPNLTLSANSTVNAAPSFWKTLQGFMGVFPQYSSHGLIIATESYGGHYGPVFTAYVEQQNELDPPGAKNIQLQGLLILNGWLDPILQYQAFYNFSVYPGNTYDLPSLNKSTETLLFNSLYGQGNCLDQLLDCQRTGGDSICSKADHFCSSQVERVYTELLDRDQYDVRYLNPDPFPYPFFGDYLNTAKVQEAIGAFTNFSSNGVVQTAFAGTGDDARGVDTIEDIRYLLSKEIAVAIIAGDADANCNWLGAEAVAEKIGAKGFAKAGYTDIRTSDGVVHGQVKQAGNFSFVRIFESGHMVPFYQPLAALALLNRTIHGLDLHTGSLAVSANYLTKGSQRSTYRQGNATVQWKVTPRNLTYDVERNRPGQPWGQMQQNLARPLTDPLFQQFPTDEPHDL